MTVSGNGTYTTAAGNNPGGYLPDRDRHLPLDGHLQRRLQQHRRHRQRPERERGGQPGRPGDQHRRPAARSSSAAGRSSTDTAVLSGGYNPTGTITFTLYNPSNVGGRTPTW